MARVDSPPSRLQVKSIHYTIESGHGSGTKILGAMPNNAVIIGHTIDVVTPVAQDGGGTAPQLTLKIGSTDILNARAFTAAPYDGTVIRPSITAFKTTAITDVTLVQNTNVLGAGAFNYFIEYYVSA